MNSDTDSGAQAFEAKMLAKDAARRTKLLSQIRKRNFGWFEGKFWWYFIASTLLVVCGFWMLRSINQFNLFTPILCIVIGYGLMVEFKVESTHRRLDALVQWLEESGTIKM